MTENLKARHCSHCFQYYFSQPGAGFFLAGFWASLLASLIPGCARNPHVLCVRSGCCAQAVNNLPAPLTPDLLAV
ncbi:hypothetical protein EJV23_03285 [Salmonella enterica subsp. enterica]|uniref:Uncharacterized protein n=1 Tax=Salmonella diarizonae TaxID=59204 RepID=A0A5Y3VE37_SALDZ|nr:hypothetical protein [Salmonella enterica]EAT5049957.1 hypothetical protein [Salmonella enterica subsp. enterica]EAW2447717.1 hypothetical protein [Salmonella enterica subsp. diarizonae]EBH8060722.1 hypothetical protein [Salmonella bongori]EBH9875223.1 hypothetical protein [Salmonella enterica subsp. enterica serovar 6,7:-1,5]EBT7752277.1 hypothetical protein [Salmonella enterica subsp. diarizonae serovar 61:k:1,5,7]EDN3877275.1 hypothetical protein [Salmonella enterica subsp. diarizonae s